MSECGWCASEGVRGDASITVAGVGLFVTPTGAMQRLIMCVDLWSGRRFGYSSPLFGSLAQMSAASYAAPFGCIIPGCLPSTAFTQIAPNKWILPLGAAADSVIVYLTGSQLLPPGATLAVWLSMENENSYEYLGHLTNALPSAVLRVPASFLRPRQGVQVILGVSLETEATMANVGQASGVVARTRVATQLQMGRRLAQDLARSATSYSRVVPAAALRALGVDAPADADAAQPSQREMVILPSDWVTHWLQRIENRMAKDDLFWVSDD